MWKRKAGVIALFVLSLFLCLHAEAASKNAERNQYFSKSAFIGSSIGVGLKNYMHSQGKGYLGNPVMLVQGCYSFANDERGSAQYRIHYQGNVYKAKDAVAAARVKRIFISMGTNDLWKDAKSTSKDYIAYVEGIRKRNPGIVVFIESTTPMCSARCRGYLNNSAIRTLNSEMQKYCERKKDVYYVDVAKGMYDKNGGLKPQYSSDGYVHLTGSAYALWMKNVTTYVDNLLLCEKKAKLAVKKAARTKNPEDYAKAKKQIQKLEKSTVKDTLKKKWKRIQVKSQSDLSRDDTLKNNSERLSV